MILNLVNGISILYVFLFVIIYFGYLDVKILESSMRIISCLMYFILFINWYIYLYINMFLYWKQMIKRLIGFDFDCISLILQIDFLKDQYLGFFYDYLILDF